MSLSRKDMLRELELLPVWKLREDGPLANRLDVADLVSEHEPKVAATAQVPAQLPEPDEVIALTDEPSLASVEPVKIAPEDVSGAGVAEAPVEENPSRQTLISEMTWEALQQSVATCQACQLAATRTQTVFGVGDPNADWLIVGEAPGAEEDRKGEPFVGQAGKLLDNMLAAIKLKRGQNVYIANVLKCRPPENRDPHGEEVQQCDPYLKRQVALIQPRLILALGKFAAQSLLNTDASIASLRGKLHEYNGVPVVVTYHPAYLLRNLPDKAKAWEDLCFAVEVMQGLQSAELPQS